MVDRNEIRRVEVDLLLDGIKEIYGYDFRDYAKASLIRRFNAFMSSQNLESYMQLADCIFHDPIMFDDLLKYLSITVSEMFRDPGFYYQLRNDVVPILKTYPFIKVWSAGCATGEETYSLAIMLHEEGLLQRTTLYATDFNNQALKMAKEGIYSAENTKKYIENYNLFGGRFGFSKYYTAKYNAIKMHDFLKERITFANHNLVTDGKFGEMNLVLCRNVMIYFNKQLTNNVLTLLKNSLCHRGFLCVGHKESLHFSSVVNDFEELEGNMKIYRKI